MLRSSQTLQKVLFILHLRRLELVSGTWTLCELEYCDTWFLIFVVLFVFFLRQGLTCHLTQASLELSMRLS